MRIAIGATLIWAMVSISSAFATETVSECIYRLSATSDELKNIYTEDCIVKQKDLIATKEEALKRFAPTLEMSWKLAMNPSEIFSLVDLVIVRNGDSQFAPRFQRLYRKLMDVMYPGLDRYNTDIDHFGPIRARFSDPGELKKLYDTGKQTIVGQVASAALKGVVGDVLGQVSVLLDQPLPIAAATAGDWYSNDCYSPEADLSDETKKTCAKLKGFETGFKATYKVEPTANHAYVLSFLYRRYMEGGPKLVSEWQHIGMDFAKEYVAQR